MLSEHVPVKLFNAMTHEDGDTLDHTSEGETAADIETMRDLLGTTAQTTGTVSASCKTVYDDVETANTGIKARMPASGAPDYATAASKVLTVAAEPAEGETVTLSTTVYKARRTELGAGAAASKAFTIAVAAPTDAETCTIGTIAYTFKDALTGTPGAGAIWVLNDGATNTATNLYNAINGGTGSGTAYKYGAGAVAHALVTATNGSAGVVTATAKTVGYAGNLIAIDETATTGSWAGAATFLSGGIDAQAANDIYTGGTAEIFIDNLVLAVTDTTNRAANIAAGKYGTATAVHATVSAAKTTSATMTATARTKGTAGNAIAVGETLSSGSSVWDNVGSTRILLQGGITGTVGYAGQVKWSATTLWVCIDAATAITTDSSGWKYITFTG
jgi:hypothetical protein